MRLRLTLFRSVEKCWMRSCLLHTHPNFVSRSNLVCWYWFLLRHTVFGIHHVIFYSQKVIGLITALLGISILCYGPCAIWSTCDNIVVYKVQSDWSSTDYDLERWTQHGIKAIQSMWIGTLNSTWQRSYLSFVILPSKFNMVAEQVVSLMGHSENSLISTRNIDNIYVHIGFYQLMWQLADLIVSSTEFYRRQHEIEVFPWESMLKVI